MQRRKYLAALGSLAAGGAAIGGTSAFNVARVDRNLTTDVVADSQAYLGLVDTGPYAKEVNEKLELDFAGNFGAQNGQGLNPDSDTTFHNVFKVVNNGTNDVRVQVSDDIETISWASDSPLTMFHSPDEKTGGDFNYSAFPNCPNPEGLRTDAYLDMSPGDEAYIHMAFYLRDNWSVTSSIDTNASAIPDIIGLYAQS